MEMMVVLLIVAIIAAASAPLVTKKLSRNAGTGDSPWVFTGLNNSIAYNMNGSDNAAAIIGASEVNRSAGQPIPKLYIETTGQEPHIGFGSRGEQGYVSLLFDRINNRVAFSDAEAGNIPNNSIALGTRQTFNTNPTNSVSIGTNTIVQNGDGTIAIGSRARVRGTGAIAVGLGQNDANLFSADGGNAISIGRLARAYTSGGGNGGAIALGGESEARDFGIAIGDNASSLFAEGIAIGRNTISEAMNSVVIGANAFSERGSQSAVVIGDEASVLDNNGSNGIAIGFDASATNGVALGSNATSSAQGAVALGPNARATGRDSVAIGNLAQATETNQIVLGNANSTVVIQGTLQAPRIRANNGRIIRIDRLDDWTWGPVMGTYVSDRRLKNVGEKYTAGLAELKKLDFFHYTFKKDKNKTPHVGVIAQDLQKVFPDAVTKDEDGYLRIRFEDMFYAVINAVKELDNKISEIVQNITNINSTIEKQNKTIEEQQKTINELLKRVEKLEKAG